MGHKGANFCPHPQILIRMLALVKQCTSRQLQQDTVDINHTPPEGSVRAKKFFITFDTNFERYLPRGTIIDGSRKCRIGAFCTIAKISGEMPKKGLKTGRNSVKFFLGPYTC